MELQSAMRPWSSELVVDHRNSDKSPQAGLSNEVVAPTLPPPILTMPHDDGVFESGTD